MRRYILLQYSHDERSDAASNVTGTFDHIKDAQAFAGNCLCHFNEIVDSHSWQVVWRLNKSKAPAKSPHFTQAATVTGSDRPTSQRP
jgi:hypothetical protein